MKEIKFVVKAEQQEKLLKSASFITAEKILFGTKFGEGLLTIDNSIIGSDSIIEEYINNKYVGIEKYDYKIMFTAKTTTALSMYILGSQLSNSWSFNAVHVNDSESEFFLLDIYTSVENCFPEGDDSEGSVNELESVYLEMVPKAIKVAESLCNYSPVAEAIIEIAQLLGKESLNQADIEYVNAILDKIEGFPYLKFLNALELFSEDSDLTEFETDDEDVNLVWNKMN